MPNAQNQPHAREAIDPILMANDHNRMIRDNADPSYMEFSRTIVRPDINFEIKGIMIQKIMSARKFRVEPEEDSHSHLRTFLDI